MGQLNSTKLNKIPYSMLWEHAVTTNRYTASYENSNLLITKYLTRSYNYINNNNFYIWNFKNFYYFSFILKKRNLIKNTINKLKLTANANKGTNKVIPGAVRSFRINNNLFFINNFLGFSFLKLKKLNKKNNVKLDNSKLKTSKKFWLKKKKIYKKKHKFYAYTNKNNFLF